MTKCNFSFISVGINNEENEPVILCMFKWDAHRDLPREKYGYWKCDHEECALQRMLSAIEPRPIPPKPKADETQKLARNKALRETSLCNAEKKLGGITNESLKWLLYDIWDYNARMWLDNESNRDTIGQETVLNTGFTTNQNKWIDDILAVMGTTKQNKDEDLCDEIDMCGIEPDERDVTCYGHKDKDGTVCPQYSNKKKGIKPLEEI